MNENIPKAKKVVKGRSPAYPYIPLGKAIERAEEFENQEGRHKVPISSATKAWDFGEKSSGGRQTLAALKYFGLVELEGAGEDRSVRVSDLCWNILKDKVENSPEKVKLIKEAALMPDIHKEIWVKYDGSLPSDNSILTYLIKDRGFNESGAQSFIAEFKATISYAKLSKSDVGSQKRDKKDSLQKTESEKDGSDSSKERESKEELDEKVNKIFSRSWDLKGGITASFKTTGIPDEKDRKFLELCINRALEELFEKEEQNEKIEKVEE